MFFSGQVHIKERAAAGRSSKDVKIFRYQGSLESRLAPNENGVTVRFRLLSDVKKDTLEL